MIVTTPNFDVAAAVVPSKPVFRFSIDSYAKVFVWRPTGRANEKAWISDIGDWSVSVDPTNGTYEIDPLTVTVLDLGAAITHDLSLTLLETRTCLLQMGYDGLGIADYVTLFAGVVDTVESNGDNTYTFTCNDFNRLLQRVLYTTGDYGTVNTTTTSFSGQNPYSNVTTIATRNNLTGQVSTTGGVSFSMNGPTGPTGSVTTTVGTVTSVKETTSRRITTSGGGDYTVYETNTTSTDSATGTVTVSTVAYGGINTYVNVTESVTTDAVTGLVSSTVSFTYTLNGPVGVTVVNDAALISSTNYRHLIGHPLDMLLDIFANQVGFADHDYNIAQIQNYRDNVFTGVEFEFYLTGCVDAKDFIENQLLKPLAGYLYPNSTGQLCIGFAQPMPGGIATVAAITPDNITALPALNASPLVNVVTLRFDKDDFSENTSTTNTGYMAEANTFYAPSIADLTDLTGQVAAEAANGSGAVQGQLIIESDGMRSGFQGFLLAKSISNALFAMYGFYNPTFDGELLWSPMFKVELTDFVTLTHPLLPNRKTGTMGIVNQIFQVFKRSYNFMDLIVTLTCSDASGIKGFGAHRIAPTGKGAYTTVSAADQARYLFQSDTGGLQSNGDKAATLG